MLLQNTTSESVLDKLTNYLGSIIRQSTYLDLQYNYCTYSESQYVTCTVLHRYSRSFEQIKILFNGYISYFVNLPITLNLPSYVSKSLLREILEK